MRLLILLVLLTPWAWADIMIEDCKVEFNPRRHNYTLTVKVRSNGNSSEPPITVKTFIRRDDQQMWTPFRQWVRKRKLPPRIRTSFSNVYDMEGPSPHPLLKEGKFQIRAEAASEGQTEPDRKETKYP